MEDCGYTWHFWSIVGFLVSLLSFVFSRIYFGSKVESMLGSSGEDAKMEDCEEATSMLVDYLSDSLQSQGRAFTETSAGCDSLTVLRNSRDIAKVIKEVHLNGGRLVLRKEGCGDIEDRKNTGLEVKKELTKLDIARAKRIERRYRR